MKKVQDYQDMELNGTNQLSVNADSDNLLDGNTNTTKKNIYYNRR